MKINRENALRLWEEYFGNVELAEDFHGNLMCKYAYSDKDYFVCRGGRKIYCGWNIHHILPKANGGTNVKSNLVCTNIDTNRQAEDKVTFWIDDCLYQVRRIPNTREYEIVELQEN